MYCTYNVQTLDKISILPHTHDHPLTHSMSAL